LTTASPPHPPAAPAAGPATPRGLVRRARLKLIAVLLVCASPVIASYFAYYVMPPPGRTNFGTLVEPQRPMPELKLVGADGRPARFAALLGQWVLLQVDAGGCDAACSAKLHAMRQQRTMTGKNRDRIERLWLVDDAVRPELPAEFEGTAVLRGDPAELGGWLPADPGHSMRDYLYLVDPQGNLMMRFPADGEPARIRKDISRLLKASRIG
jgi:hypothetical protein